MATTEADLTAMTRAQLDDLATQNGLDPADYANKGEEIAALTPLVSQEVPMTETPPDTSTPESAGGLDPMLVDPAAVQKEALAGSTSDPSTHVEGYAIEDVKADPSTATDKASDAEDYAFPQGGDVDVALLEVVEAEGELFVPPSIEDWVVLDGASAAVPDALDGRRAAIIEVSLDPVPIAEKDTVPLVVRTRDDYAATLSITMADVKEVQKRGISPVR
jgi:hypothetical protein